MKQMQPRSLRFMTEAGLIGGMYAALCLLLAPISYGAVQVRVAEALTVLPVFTTAAIPGLTIGCLIANLLAGGAVGAWDWLLGTLTTLVAAWMTRACREVTVRGLPLLSLLPPVLLNALVIGGEIAVVGGQAALFPLYAVQIAAGQTVACFGGGLLLYGALKRVYAQIK